MWYSAIMDDDEFELISEEELLMRMAQAGQQLEPLVGELAELQVRFTERVMGDDTHECPVDHSVLESLEQAKLRMSESVMWLKTAIATKIGDEPMVHVHAPVEHDPEKVN